MISTKIFRSTIIKGKCLVLTNGFVGNMDVKRENELCDIWVQWHLKAVSWSAEPAEMERTCVWQNSNHRRNSYIHVHTYTKIIITLLEHFWQTKLFEFFLTALGSIQARADSSRSRGAVRPKENGKKWGSTPRFSNLSFASYTAVCPAPKSSPGGKFLETALIQATLHWYRLNLPKFLFTIFI